MEQFKPGDRVMYIGDGKGVMGRTGTVVYDPALYPDFQVRVQWDGGEDNYTTPLIKNLKHIIRGEVVQARGAGTGWEYEGILLTKSSTEGDNERAVKLTKETKCHPEGTTVYVAADSIRPVRAEPTVRARVLDEAKRITATDRNSAYGEPEDNFQRIADFWNVFLQDKLKDGQFITAGDTAALVIMVKLAREMNTPKEDNKVDIAGYAACWAEVDAKKS